MKVKNWLGLLGIAAAGTFFAGCAQDVGDIDRTQPNKVEKSLFESEDEWYYRQTVIDTDQVASAGGGYAFEALEGSLHRIRWSITEDVLYAYSTVEPAEGVYDGQIDPERGRYGVVAAFPITGHFDVERSYNASTGEQSNVIVENSSDRHWYERKYMRVDWSTNLTANAIFDVTGAGGVGTFSATKRVVPQEAGEIDPDRTRLSDDYIDTVTEYYYEPDIYACFTTLGFDAVFNCEGGPLRVRNSFLKKGPDDYIPLEYTDNVYLTEDDKSNEQLYTMNLYDPGLGKIFPVQCNEFAKTFERTEFGYAPDDACRPATFDMFGRFGYFRTERVMWDGGRGANQEESRLYYANRWNIWETMLREDGSELPMEERTPKPIVFYTNLEYPRDMIAGADEVADQWNETFLEAVMHAKGLDSKDDVREELIAAGHEDGRMFAIRLNSCSGPELQKWFDAGHGAAQDADRLDVPTIIDEFQQRWGTESLEDAVWASTHDARASFCAELEYATETRDAGAFTYQRVGDLRYSFFNWVDEEVPWLGYGPSAADPVTGEIISGNANFAGAAIRTYGPYAADLIMYMNGELAEEDIMRGDHIRDHLLDIREDQRTKRQSLSPEGKRELVARAGVAPTQVSPSNFAERPEIHELPYEILRYGHEAAEKDALRNVIANEYARSTDTRLTEFYGKPSVRQFMMQDPNFALMVEAKAAMEFGPDYDEADIKQAFLNTTNPLNHHDRYAERNKIMSSRNMCFHSRDVENALQSLVTYSGVNDAYKGKPREEIERLFIHNMFVGTQLHEVGHTVGLRHNFAGSTDTMNYHDEFWEIEKAIARGDIEPEERFSVPKEKAKEIIGYDIEYLNEAEFRLSTVMDYTGDLTGRFGGLGKYDQAAINFAYGEVVEEWAPNDVLTDEFGVQGGLGNYYDTEIWLSDYTELPRIMANVAGNGPTQDPDVQLRGIDVIQNGRVYVPIKQAMLNKREGIITNSINWENGEFVGNRVEPYIDRTVPYEYCDDSYRGLQLNCDVYDWGSNQREIVNHQFNTYRLFQPFRRYNRGRIYRNYENLSSYQNWVFNIFQIAQNPFRYYSYFQWYDLGAYTDDLRDASIDAINFYTEVIATPEPGRYCSYTPTDTTDISPYWWYDLGNTYVPASWDRLDGACNNYIDIKRGPGQFYNYEFTDEYEYRIERVGTYVDKSVASLAMFQISGNYVNSSFFTDFRATNVSYWTLFRDEMLDYMRGLMIGDYSGFAGVYDRQTQGYVRPRLIDMKSFGLGIPSDQAGMPRIYTPMSFQHDFNFLVGGMLFNSTWYDRHTDYAQYVKLAVANDEAQPFPEATELHEFVHPTTNQVYVAAQSTDGKSIAVEMVQWANELKVRFEDSKENLELQEPGTADYAAARELHEFRSEQLEDVIAKMDMIRYVWDALGADALR